MCIYIYIYYTYKHIILVYPSKPTSDDDPQWSLFCSSGLQGINFVIDLSQEMLVSVLVGLDFHMIIVNK